MGALRTFLETILFFYVLSADLYVLDFVLLLFSHAFSILYILTNALENVTKNVTNLKLID